MTVARELAEFLTRTASSDLLRQAVEHAAMLIASTLASAALGTGLESSGIIRDLARERGGRPDASLWFHPGDKLPMTDAAQVNAVASARLRPTTATCAISSMPARPSSQRRLLSASGPAPAARRCWRQLSLGMKRRGASGRRSRQASAAGGFTAVLYRSLPLRLPPGASSVWRRRRWLKRLLCRQPRSAA